jgi:hypothetical protein
MSNKSLFDKLFNEVMQSDEEALGIPQDDEGGAFGGEGEAGDGESFGDEGDESFGDEGDEGGDVTLTMDRATAEKLKDLIDSALGGGMGEEEDEMGEDDLGGEFGDEDEGGMGEEEGGAFGESPAVETMEELPTQKYVDALTGKKNKVEGALAAKTTGHGEGSGEVTQAHPLKKMSTAYNDGKGSKNRVNSPYYKEKNSKTNSYLH